MEVNEFTMFILGPFATGIYMDPGKLSSVEDEFLRDIAVERGYQIRRKTNLRGYSKQSVAKMTMNLDSSVFPYMERINESIKFVLDDYEVSSNSITYKFENNTVYFYEAGSGLFSTQVRVRFRRGENVDSVKEAERFARDIVIRKYENQLSSLRDMFSETITKKGIVQVTRFESDSFVVERFGWLHTAYYFCNPEFLEDNEDFINRLRDNILKDLSTLLDQVPHEMSSSMNHYVFFGDGRSLIVTKVPLQGEIVRLVRLLETYQYFYFALIQLDTFLLNEMYNPTIGYEYQENSSVSIDQILKNLQSEIKDLEKFRSLTIRYLELFRYVSNVLVISDRSLIKEQENQWDMDRIEKDIRNKLDSFYRELSSIKQALLAEQQVRSTEEQKAFTKQQNYLNNLILVITVISLGSVTAQILVLPPLDDTFPPDATDFYRTQLFIVLFVTAIIILIILLFYAQKLQGIRSKAKGLRSKAKGLNKKER